MEQLNTIRATAERAKAEGLAAVSEKALRRWVKEGAIPYVPAGNRCLIYWPNLLRFLEKGKTAGEARPLYGPGSRGGRRK